MDNNSEITTEYEAPALKVVGTLADITKGGSENNNELADQTQNNQDAFPVVS